MKSENLKFSKIRKVKSPTRAHSDDAGIDFYVPEDLTFDQMLSKFQTTGTQPAVSFDDSREHITQFRLKPMQSILLPSGIKANIPDGYALIFHNKSGIAAKKHLLVGSAVVDQNYQGEMHINLHNVGDCEVTIAAGDKVVQGIVLPINYCDLEEVPLDKLYDGKVTDRGEGGFGSTGTK